MTDVTAALNARFVELLTPHVDDEVAVWNVRFDRRYRKGQLLRVETDHLILAGFGVIPLHEIEYVSVGPETLVYAVPL